MILMDRHARWGSPPSGPSRRSELGVALTVAVSKCWTPRRSPAGSPVAKVLHLRQPTTMFSVAGAPPPLGVA